MAKNAKFNSYAEAYEHRNELARSGLIQLREDLLNWSDEVYERGTVADNEKELFHNIPTMVQQLDHLIGDKKSFNVSRSVMESPDFQKQMSRVQDRDDFQLGRFIESQLVGRDNMNKRAITSTTGSAFIPRDFIEETIFDALANNPLGDLGVRFMSLNEGSQWPRITAYPTVDWVASQGTEISLDSALTIGSVKNNYKDLAVRMSVQNQVLLDSMLPVEQVLQTAAEMAINDAVLDAVFHADGTGGKPTGLDSLSGVNTVAGGSVVLADYAEIRAGIYQLLKDNVRLDRIGMAAHPVIWHQLSGLEDTTGQPLLKPMGVDTMPMRFTSAIDINQGAGSDTTIYLADWSQLAIATQGPYRMTTDNRASYLQTEIILWLRVDFNFLQEDHFCRIANVAAGTTT